MFFLKSVLEFLILPPVNLVLAIVVGLLVLRTRPCLGRWIIGASTALLLLLGMPAVGYGLLIGLEQGLPMTPPPGDPPAAIVILGADVRLIREPPGISVGPLALQRLRAGAALYRKTHLPILISGGVIGSDEPPVSLLMAHSLEQDFHVPVRWIEDRSRDTWENASDSAAILRRAGIRSIYLVTHAWHERRALIAFRHTGLIVTAAPTKLDRYPPFGLGDFVPTAKVWLYSYFAVHEWVGCIWYELG